MNMFLTFQMNNMKYYHDFYLTVNVLLLASVFETFRKGSISSFELDLDYYLSTPASIWDAILRFTNVNLKLISDIEKNSLKAQKAVACF